MNELLKAALAYARRGWHVFPCHWPIDGDCSCKNSTCQNPAKHPLTPAGFKDAVTDEEIIRAWWKKWPQANVAIATGAVSGIVVVDVDSREAAENFKARVPEIDLKSIPRVATGRGWHLYFRHPGGVIPCRSGVLPGIDVRGDGGYCLAPPSVHASGKAYR